MKITHCLVLELSDDIDLDAYRIFTLHMTDKVKIKDVSFEITDNKGDRKKVKEKESLVYSTSGRKVLISDNKAQSWSLGALGAGYKIEYNYTYVFNDVMAIAPFRINFMKKLTIDTLRIKFKFPDDKWRLKYSLNNGPCEYMDREKQAKFDQYSILGKKESEYKYAPIDRQPGIYYSFESLTSEDDFSEWDEVYEWSLPKYELDNNPDTELLGITTDISEIFRNIKEKCRYVAVEMGDGSYKPDSALNVWEKGYGDCKGLANLFIYWANAAGYKAWPVLIYAGKKKQGYREFPSPFQFNHVIAGFKNENGDTLYQDLTAKTYGLGETPLWLYGCFAFPVASDSKPFRFDYINQRPDTVKYQLVGFSDDKGKFSGYLKGTYWGSPAKMIIYGDDFSRSVEIGKLLKLAITNEIPNAILGEFNQIEKSDNEIIFDINIKTSKLFFKKNENYIFKPWIFDVFDDINNADSTIEWLIPIKTNTHYMFEYRVNIDSTLIYENISDNSNVTSRNFDYSIERKTENDSLFFNCEIYMKPRILDKINISEYNRDISNIKKVVSSGMLLN